MYEGGLPTNTDPTGSSYGALLVICYRIRTSSERGELSHSSDVGVLAIEESTCCGVFSGNTWVAPTSYVYGDYVVGSPVPVDSSNRKPFDSWADPHSLDEWPGDSTSSHACISGPAGSDIICSCFRIAEGLGAAH